MLLVDWILLLPPCFLAPVCTYCTLLFGPLALLVVPQEGRPACKNLCQSELFPKKVQHRRPVKQKVKVVVSCSRCTYAKQSCEYIPRRVLCDQSRLRISSTQPLQLCLCCISAATLAIIACQIIYCFLSLPWLTISYIV